MHISYLTKTNAINHEKVEQIIIFHDDETYRLWESDKTIIFAKKSGTMNDIALWNNLWHG